MASATTTLSVWNLALGRLRSKLATSTNTAVDTSKQAAACDREWEPTKVAALASHAWSFCTQRITLSEYGDPGASGHPKPAGIWDGRYKVSWAAGTGYDRILSVIEVRHATTEERVEWEWTTDRDESDAQQQWLYADTTDDLILTAIVDVDEAQWPEYVVSLVAWELASAIAVPLTGNVELAQWAIAQATLARSKAEDQDRRRSSRKGPPALRVRRSSSPIVQRYGRSLQPVEGEV